MFHKMMEWATSTTTTKAATNNKRQEKVFKLLWLHEQLFFGLQIAWESKTKIKCPIRLKMSPRETCKNICSQLLAFHNILRIYFEKTFRSCFIKCGPIPASLDFIFIIFFFVIYIISLNNFFF